MTSPDQHVQGLFIRHTGVIRGFVLALLPDFHAADDVLQETFLTMTAKAAQFEPGTDFLAWVRSIARLKVLEHYRKRKSGPQHLDPQVLSVLAEDAPPEPDDNEDHRRALEDCLKHVPPKSRTIVDLRYAKHLRPPEIASKLSWSVNAIHVALSRIRKALRDCTERKLSTAEV
jgi:RNA polymerase sigma-70 factor (ECF subfamily)